jgi:hypothetical protein
VHQEDDDLIICSAADCFRAAILRIHGMPFCKHHAEVIAKPKTQPAAATITPKDISVLEKDRETWAAIMNAKVSDATRKACEEELRQAAQRGWKRKE